jgi:hypothetical protein
MISTRNPKPAMARTFPPAQFLPPGSIPPFVFAGEKRLRRLKLLPGPAIIGAAILENRGPGRISSTTVGLFPAIEMRSCRCSEFWNSSRIQIPFDRTPRAEGITPLGDVNRALEW